MNGNEQRGYVPLDPNGGKGTVSAHEAEQLDNATLDRSPTYMPLFRGQVDPREEIQS